MMPGFLVWMTGQRAPPFPVIARGGGTGRSRGVRRKVTEFDLDRWSVILLEICNRQIEIERSGLAIYWKLLLNLKPGTSIPRIIIVL